MLGGCHNSNDIGRTYHAKARSLPKENGSTANDISMTVMASPRLTQRRSTHKLVESTRALPMTLMH